MDSSWIKVIKITGVAGLIVFLIYFVLDKIFDVKLIEFFGRDRAYYLVIFVFAVLAILMAMAMYSSSRKDSREEKAHGEGIKSERANGPKVVYKDRSSHHGDNNF